MDDNMLKQNYESNYKLNSMAGAVMVRWRWDHERTHRIFLRLRYGGRAENQYDLDVKYPKESYEKVTLLLHSDQLANLSRREKIEKIVDLLNDSSWKWEETKELNFTKIVNRFLK